MRSPIDLPANVQILLANFQMPDLVGKSRE